MRLLHSQGSKRIAVFSLLGLLFGCASIAVTDEAIVKKTAFELGLEPSEFKISNRENDGVTTTYIVKTNKQKTFNCYVAGSISVLGRTVSSPVCNEVGKKSDAPSSSSSSSTCNALLKAAGKC